MAKDPAFLFYSKDWIEGTAEMYPEEKGVYIDLLSHQHQKGSLPRDPKRLAKIVGISIEEFNRIWETLNQKFVEIDNRLVNQKLEKVKVERAYKGHRNTISGTFASLIRKTKLSKKELKLLKDSFNIDEFMDIQKERLTECLTEWFEKRLKSIANADGNETINININESGSKDGNLKNYIYPIEVLDVPGLREALEKWFIYRKELKLKDCTDISFSKQIKFLLAQPDPIAVIEHSIRNNYQGLFELKRGQNGRTISDEQKRNFDKIQSALFQD